MQVLITLKTIRLQGEIVQPGTMIRVEDEQGLIDKVYARRLTKEESQAILNYYVLYTDKIFNKPHRISPPSQSKEAGVHGQQERLPF
jgi:hypothetical protein